jgi:phospholipid/cholesterol/gamma-HCH transport system permease protein
MKCLAERCFVIKLLEFVGTVSRFAFRVIVDFFRPPFEGAQMLRQLAEAGYRSLPLVVASGFALGTVMTLHTRSTLVTFGAASMIPTGAVLANMRATEQIDGIESLSIDSFKFLVVPRVVACVVALPLLTLFMDFSGLLGGFLSEFVSSRISFELYITRAFSDLEWSNFIPPTLKTSIFGFIIGVVSSYFGYTTDEGAQGVGKAATNSVVVSSLLIILADVILIKLIFFAFPDSAL